ncbi:MAG: dockerin type I repeat-containing protein [Phycisphaerales bacterium]|nr:dockerin type I repeat-containing protein [Phycisphaerales bacterium]MCI0675160.1 dockerin type I repeat-containing protein [Phycisphaerales bacterium]
MSNGMVGFLAGVCCAGIASTASATFQLMQIEQVIGGVNGDVTEQAIQLRLRAAGENLVSGARIRAWDAAGANPVIIIDMASDVPNGAMGSRVLISSANFNDDTNPPASPNFTMTNPIPSSYLAAGSLTYESDAGVVYWRLSWGGVGYTGPCNVAMENDINQNACPPEPGPMPWMSLQALKFQGTAAAPSTDNASDYFVTGSAATFTNNAGANFVLQGPAVGACCIGSNCAELLSQSDCEGKFGGVWQGPGVTCDIVFCQAATGACCLPGGGCAGMQTAEICVANGGVYMGDNSECSPTICANPVGACCMPGGACVSAQTQIDCNNAGGAWQGPGSTCGGVNCTPPVVGACCFPEACFIFTEGDCEKFGGVYQGDFTDCAKVVCPPPCVGDINGDGLVNVADLLLLIGNWGPGGGFGPADLDQNGVVNVADLLLLIGNWGPC